MDVEVGITTGLLHQPHEIAAHPFGFQFGREVTVEHHHAAPIGQAGAGAVHRRHELERVLTRLESHAPGDDDEDTKAGRTTPDLPVPDSLAVTQESPTIERSAHSDWATTMESATVELAADAPTVETPTIESPAARSR